MAMERTGHPPSYAEAKKMVHQDSFRGSLGDCSSSSRYCDGMLNFGCILDVFKLTVNFKFLAVSEKKLTSICEWMISAGFPQYVQLYRGM